jgi:hypothetical protein
MAEVRGSSSLWSATESLYLKKKNEIACTVGSRVPPRHGHRLLRIKVDLASMAHLRTQLEKVVPLGSPVTSIVFSFPAPGSGIQRMSNPSEDGGWCLPIAYSPECVEEFSEARIAPIQHPWPSRTADMGLPRDLPSRRFWKVRSLNRAWGAPGPRRDARETAAGTLHNCLDCSSWTGPHEAEPETRS